MTVGTKYNKQIQGTRIKHFMGANSIKMYDKASKVLRVETTVNDIGEFKVYREVLTRSGQSVKKFASMKKSIYSLHDLTKQCQSSNARYKERKTFGKYPRKKLIIIAPIKNLTSLTKMMDKY